MLSRVIKNSSDLIAPLEDIIAGGNAKDTIAWNDELHAAFDRAQKALSTHKAITLPRPSDQLWIVTDGALRKLGLGATLYVGREGKPLLAGFFSAKLRPNQRQWLPCEIGHLLLPLQLNTIAHSSFNLNCQPVYSQTASLASKRTRNSVEVNSPQVLECVHS